MEKKIREEFAKNSSLLESEADDETSDDVKAPAPAPSDDDDFAEFAPEELE